MHSSHMNTNCSFYYNNLEDPNLKPDYMQQSTVENGCLIVKKSSKKDRHSKIDTARGPRDRRMRLSLDVAKKFFRLQDMLGFDKASNTIEWLIMKSTSAIQDLVFSHQSTPSSASECDQVVSGIDDHRSTEKTHVVKDESKLKSCSSKKKERKRLCLDQSFVKETRERERARARKRTSEKIRNNKLGYNGESSFQFSKPRLITCEVMDQNTNRFGSWIPFGENLNDQIIEYPISHLQFKQGDNSTMVSSNWSHQPFVYNYQHNPGISHEHQFSDFQILGKPWEGK